MSFLAKPNGGLMVGTTAANVQASATPQVKGSWVQFGTAPPGTKGLYVTGANNNTTAICMYDVGKGASGSQQVICPNFWALAVSGRQWCNWYFPISIEEGEKVWLRKQSGTASAITAMSLDYVTGWNMPSYTHCVSLGDLPAGSRGTQVDPGSVGVWSSWVQFSASCPFNVRAVSLYHGGYDGASVDVDYRAELGVGAAASETTIFRTQSGRLSAPDVGVNQSTCNIPIQIAKGERIALRTKQTNTYEAALAYSMHLWG